VHEFSWNFQPHATVVHWFFKVYRIVWWTSVAVCTHAGDASLGQRCHVSALDITIGWFRAVLFLATETDPIRAGGWGGHTRVGLCFIFGFGFGFVFVFGFVFGFVLVLTLFIISSTVSCCSLVDVFSTGTPMVVLSSQQHPH
jgi:hypothetical protein